MAELIAALKATQFPPEVLRKLGLPPNWSSRLPEDFLKHLAAIIEKYRGTLEELARY